MVVVAGWTIRSKKKKQFRRFTSSNEQYYLEEKNTEEIIIVTFSINTNELIIHRRKNPYLYSGQDIYLPVIIT